MMNTERRAMMIRKLLPADEPELLAVLRRDRHNNLFLLGNLHSMGWADPDLEYTGMYDGKRLVGVLMRFRANWALYDEGGADFAAMARLIEAYPTSARAITGENGLVSRLWEHIVRYEAYADHPSYYCALQTLVPLPGVRPARRATDADAAGLAELYAEAGEMARDEAGVRRVLAQGRFFVAEEGGQIVAAALTSSEAPDMAMIGGVFTPPHLRNRGYATACVEALCRELLNEGIEPCLFYDNPRAGSIYRRLGFRDVGMWRLLRLREKKG
jgi:hypothetical protein